MPTILKSRLQDAWVTGSGPGQDLHDPATGDVVARASSAGLDLPLALAHARELGGENLRAMTFRERADVLEGLANTINAGREELIELSTLNAGTTRRDGKFDVDGGAHTLMSYAYLGRELGDVRFLADGTLEPLGRSPRFSGCHIKVPRRGVAVHINAFNFPIWGIAEKLACALLAGMPVLTKPATATALPAARCAELFVAAGVLPGGSWSFLAGGAGDLLDHLGPQDVIAFTGSADTAARLRRHVCVTEGGTRLNAEADSLNAVVVGPDVEPGSDAWKLFMTDLVREITQKSGQKCTATRRAIVPACVVDAAVTELGARLSGLRVGPPGDPRTDIGPLATPDQFAGVVRALSRLAEGAEPVIGSVPTGSAGPGAFLSPVVLLCRDPLGTHVVHEVEVFGPVCTLMPYAGDARTAGRIVARAQGGLVATVYTEDQEFAGAMLAELAPWSGRILFGSRRILEHSTGPGLVLPELAHGGPGRAGGGLELGGRRGLDLYLQTTALQGPRALLEALVPR